MANFFMTVFDRFYEEQKVARREDRHDDAWAWDIAADQWDRVSKGVGPQAYVPLFREAVEARREHLSTPVWDQALAIVEEALKLHAAR